MLNEEKKQHLRYYIESMSRIRELSSPEVQSLPSADAYRSTLLRNFARIGELSRINTEILDTYYFPALKDDAPLAVETIDIIRGFSDGLVNAFSLESLDLPMAHYQSVRLLLDAEAKKDDALIIRALDELVVTCYSMMDIMQRVTPGSDAMYRFRDQGIAAAERIISFLEPSRFRQLPDEKTKELVLINARYIRVMFEGNDKIGDEATVEYILRLMKRALSLADDAFYRSQVPSYDWTYHTFRTLEYISSLTDHNNVRGCTTAQIREINLYTKRMLSLVDSDPSRFETILSRDYLELYRIRNAYLDNEMTLHEYRHALLHLYHSYDTTQFSLHTDLRALHTIYEYIATLDREKLTRQQERSLKKLYDDLIGYMHRLPKTTSMSFLISYFTDILKVYREIPGGMDFETFGLNLMAAIHPPTYVHSLSVATFATCLAKHLLKKNPSLFTGMPGYETAEDVISGENDILDFVCHAGLCHDFGKLTIIDIIMTYGRRLFESDLELIFEHPAIGAHLLERFERTRPYAEVARGHHRWFDNSDGYPDDFDMVRSPYRTVIAVVACADCLDAATDDVGRSYKSGITLDQFLAELHAGSGTRYAPYLAELLADTEVRADIETLLASARDENYRNVWRILKKSIT
ncbi:MAG: HD domain-containing protein [Lachnospiraceae bacterium]|nr:HD domain-containing protein [Lachnospiraceae bacterium]